MGKRLALGKWYDLWQPRPVVYHDGLFANRGQSIRGSSVVNLEVGYGLVFTIATKLMVL